MSDVATYGAWALFLLFIVASLFASSSRREPPSGREP